MEAKAEDAANVSYACKVALPAADLVMGSMNDLEVWLDGRRNV